MRFTYAYKTSDGIRHEDAMDAPSREEAFAALRARGIRAIKVVAADGSKANGEVRGVRGRTVAAIAAAAAALAAMAAFLLSRAPQPPRGGRPPASSAPRHQIYGDPATVEALERGDFARALPREGDRMLAVFAQPGRLMCARGADPRRLDAAAAAAFEAYARDGLAADMDVAVDGGEAREVRELKQIVNGMREEMRTYLSNGNGTPASFWRRLNERALREMQIFERARRELEGETSPEAWEGRNAALRRLGLRTIPNPNE